jgi:hypothetical protein
MNFEKRDHFWQDAARFLLGRFDPQARLLALNEFHKLFPGVYPYSTAAYMDLGQMEGFVIHKGMIRELSAKTGAYLIDHCLPIFGNEVFVIFVPRDKAVGEVVGREHFDSFYVAFEQWKKEGFPPPWSIPSQFKEPTTVVLMTTFNRPHFLARSLPGILALRAPLLVVNDGSSEEHRAAYQEIYRRYDLKVIELPENRGLPNALNTGLGYWLADPMVEWISYLQDDTEVRPDLLQVLAKFQDPEKQPLLSGRDSPQHEIYSEEMRDGYRILWKRMNDATHLHAHRDYWQRILPIPAPYFQAPKRLTDRPGRGSDSDWWIIQWSPHSIVKKGGYLCAIPGLVRTFVSDPSDSTWGGAAHADPPLASPL